MGVCLEPGFPMCILTEKLNGNLLEIANNGTLDINFHNVVRIAADVISGMAHLHVGV